ncbi:MAG TPA: PhzF family phenazine biosynthesis protein [Polyangiaceae bacterium]
MKTYTYHLLDVFTNVPFGGNPLAVFTDARGLSDEQMKSIARELNLSETTFVLPARDRSHHSWVRIFTPLAEVTSGGHPTIGTAHALALEERVRRETARQRVVFEEGIGPVSVLMEAPMITVRLPLPEFGPIFEQRDAVAAMLGLEPIHIAAGPIHAISCGVSYLVVPIVDLEAMNRIRFRVDIWDRMLRHSPHPQVLPFSLETRYPECTVHARMFAPGLGVYEDPATAGAAGPLAAYLIRYGVIRPDPRAQLIVEQGIEVERPSFIHVSVEMDGERFSSIRVGGQCVVIGKGQIHVNVPD